MVGWRRDSWRISTVAGKTDQYVLTPWPSSFEAVEQQCHQDINISEVRFKNHHTTLQICENPDASGQWPNAGRTVLIFIFNLMQLLRCFVCSTPLKGTVYVFWKDWSIVVPFIRLDEDKDKIVWRKIQRMERTTEHIRGLALYIFHQQSLKRR